LQAAVADQEPQTKKQHRKRQRGAFDQASGKRRHHQDASDHREGGLQLQRRLLWLGGIDTRASGAVSYGVAGG
jgi:hypothetical protein